MDKTKAYEIKKDLYWVGALDPDLRTFDVVMYTATGSSYNSYVVKGEKTAVIECVKEAFFDEWQARLADAGVDIASIDYLVMNHTEPDHSGGMRRLMELAPDMKILCTRPAATLLREITNTDLNIQVVGDNEEVDLGGYTLRFISAPFLHWPDTMFTYIPEMKALMPCDVFGFHHCTEGIFDDSVDMEQLREQQRYYYDVIMSPFANYVQQACAKVRKLELDVICPCHGPVQRQNPWEAIELYEKWSAPESWSPQRAFIGYVSCYGYTTMLAEAAAHELNQLGLDVNVVDITEAGPEKAADMAMQSDLILIGSPTVNRDALPPVWDLLTRISAIRTRGRIGAAFGSYGWSGEATKFILARMEQLGLQTAGAFITKMYPDEKALEGVRTLAVEAAEKLNK